MLTFRCLRWLLVGLFMLSASAMPSSAGTLIVNSDEWTITQTGFNMANASTTRFVQNIISVFGGPGAYLAYTPPTTAQGGNTSLTGDCCTGGSGAAGTSLRDTVVGTGSTWTVTTGITFDLPTLLQYKGIFLTGPTVFSPPGCGSSPAAPPCGYPNNQVLVDYVNAGGNIYLQGGVEWNRETEKTAWGTLLNAFGLGFEGGTGLNGFTALVDIAAQNYNDPLFDGVTQLYFNNGNWVELLPPHPHAKLFEYEENGLFGIYQFDNPRRVPEPASILLLSGGLFGFGIISFMRHRQRTTRSAFTNRSA